MSTSNNEAPLQEYRVCWHYLKGNRVHTDECTCLLCAGLDLDAICCHHLSGECAHDDGCGHLHPPELDPALLPLLVTPPYSLLKSPPPPMAGQGTCRRVYVGFITEEVADEYEGGGSFTLPLAHCIDYSLPHAPASVNADGQPSDTCAGYLQHCWAPHSAKPVGPGFDPLQPATSSQPAAKKRRLEVDDVCSSAGESHAASADVDMDVDMVDQFAKTTLDSEAMEI